jgi:dihydrofolate reductase
MNKRKIIAVWAEDENGLIGKDNGLPWKKPEDLKHFKETTINKIIVMGSKTFEGLRKKTLPNRTTIILTRDLNYEANGAIICNSIDEVLKSTNDDLYIVGGKEVYKSFFPYLTDLIKTEIKGTYEGDTYIDNTFNYLQFKLDSIKQLSDDVIVKYFKRLSDEDYQ